MPNAITQLIAVSERQKIGNMKFGRLTQISQADVFKASVVHEERPALKIHDADEVGRSGDEPCEICVFPVSAYGPEMRV